MLLRLCVDSKAKSLIFSTPLPNDISSKSELLKAWSSIVVTLDGILTDFSELQL